MSFPRKFIQDLQDRIVLSDIIGKRVKITRAGRDEYKACCPFHDEKTPSFTLNNQKGFYHCFGCGAHGDAISFLQDNDNLSFMEAVEQLAAMVGMEVPKPTKEDQVRFEKQKTLYDLMDAVTSFFENTLTQNRAAMDYLTDRGLTRKTIKSFRIGFSPADGQALRLHLEKEGYAVKDMIEAGVIRPSTKRQGETYSFFRDRIMFPVLDLRGRVVAFGGRIMPGMENQGGGKAPKYINSSDTVLFHKGQILYNLSEARKSVEQNKPFIVVEGYMDVIALAQAGYDTAVAPLGTALTEGQIEVLWKVAPPDARVPVLCFDGDNAGRRAASRAMARTMPLLRPDHSLRFAFLPEGEDPDSLIQSKGRAEFDTFLSTAGVLSNMLWEEELAQRPGTTPEDRAGLKKALSTRIQEITDSDVQNEYMHMLMGRYRQHFSPQKKSFQGRLFSNRPGGYFQPDRLAPLRTTPQPVKTVGFDVPHYGMAALLNYPALFDEMEEALGTMEIRDPELQNLRQSTFEALQDNEVLDSSDLKDILKSAGYESLLDDLSSESLYLQAVFARPDQNLQDVREGWRFTMDRYRKRRTRK